MSSAVCQGLQSCLEPWLVEPRAVGLKLAAPSTHFPQPLRLARRPPRVSEADSDSEDKSNNDDNNNSNNNNNIGDNNSKANHSENKKAEINSNGDLGGWSFIQALTDTSQSQPKEAKEEKESLYVHPLVKRSSSTLSEKSLELCTENLGCETGSDISENCDISSSSSDSESGKSPTREQSKLRQFLGHKKVNCHSFPPPLTSIRGSNCVHMRPHREGGRLVIKAVMVPSLQTYFQAERSDGRLRLRFLTNYNSPSLDSEAAAVEDGKVVNHDEEEEEQEQEEENEVEHEEVENQEEEEEENGVDMEEMDGTNETSGGEMGMEKFQRPSRCKEGGRGNKGMVIWGEPFWVAT